MIPLFRVPMLTWDFSVMSLPLSHLYRSNPSTYAPSRNPKLIRLQAGFEWTSLFGPWMSYLEEIGISLNLSRKKTTVSPSTDNRQAA